MSRPLSINTYQDKLGTYKPFFPTSYRKENKQIANYNICLMKEYEDRFPFLIRLEDYRKGDTFTAYLNSNPLNTQKQMNNNSFGNNNSNGFGQNNNNGGFGFNQNNNNSSFGQNKSSFGFGNNNNNSSFGQNNNSGFGSTNTNTSTGFGFSSNNNSGFGSNNNNSSFGANNNSSGFGQNKTGFGFGANNSNTTTGFGASNNNNNSGFGFGANNNNNSTGFGANNNKTGFGFGSNNNSNTGFGFGNNSNNNNTGFGANNNNNTGFGANNNNQTGFGFGANNNNNTGFGANNNNSTGFGQNKTGFGFGTNNNNNTGFGTNNNNNTGFGTNNNNKTGFGFGSNNNNNTGFGSSNNTSGFGANKTGFGFGTSNNNTGFGANNNTGFGANNNTGFGFGTNNNTGFGANNNTGFGANNNTGFGFGTNNNTGFGFGNNSNANQAPGLLAGGFNTINAQIQKDPYNHLQNLTKSIVKTEERMKNQNIQLCYSDSSPVSSIARNYSTSQRLVEATPAPSPSPSQSLPYETPVIVQEEKEKTIGVQYNLCSRVFKIKNSLSFNEFKEEVKTAFSIQSDISFSFLNICLSGESLQEIPEGALLTVLISTPQSQTSSYKNNSPTLTKPGYSITPSIESLSRMMNFELKSVSNVVIENKGVGKIEWEEPIDLSNVNLDEVIEIEMNKTGSAYISVYENIDSTSPSYPAVGTGINHPAILTFYNVFPAKGDLIPEDVLREKTKECGGEFLSYDSQSGTWRFRVPHFTRYGFDLSDEELSSEENTGRPASDLKRVQFHSITDLFYQSKQPRLFQNSSPVLPPSPTPLDHVVNQALACPSSRSNVISKIQQTSFPSARKTSSPGSSFTSLFHGNTLLTTQRLTHIHTEPVFDQSTADELDNILDILRSFTVYPEDEQGLVPQIKLQRNEALQSFLNQLITFYSDETPKSRYKCLLFQLLQLLFISPETVSSRYVWKRDETFSLKDLSNEQQQLLFHKRRLLIRWLEQALRSELWDVSTSDSNSVFATCVKFLMIHDIDNACQCLKAEGYERLALQLSQISIPCLLCLRVDCSDDFRSVMFEQVQQWKEEGVLDAIDPSQFRLLTFLAGDVSILSLTSSWIVKLALFTWYIASPQEPIESVLTSFVFSVIQEDEFIPPWYASASDCEEEEGLFLLIEYFVHLTVSLEYDESALFQPTNYCADPLDSSLPFLTSLVLSTQLLSHFDSSISLALSFSFMEQLNAMQLWHWAVLIALFQPHQPLRERLVRALVGQHIGDCVEKSEEEDVEAIQRGLQQVMEHEKISAVVNDFGVSPKIVYEALSFYAHYEKNVLLEVTCQLSADDYNGAFVTLLHEIIPLAIRKNDLSLLQMSLNFFANHETEVLLWREIGDILEGYIDFLTMELSTESFMDGKDLLAAIANWSQFDSIIKKKDMESMVREMTWRILAQLLEWLKLQETVDWDAVNFIIQQLSSTVMNYDIKKLLYDTLRNIVSV